MILVIFILKFLCFLLDPFWFISLIVIRITIITQEFIQANIAILIIINIWKGEKKLWKHYYNNGLFRQADEITVCSGKNPIWTPSCSFAPVPNPFSLKLFLQVTWSMVKPFYREWEREGLLCPIWRGRYQLNMEHIGDQGFSQKGVQPSLGRPFLEETDGKFT